MTTTLSTSTGPGAQPNKRRKKDDRPPPDLRQQVCSSCESAWPWVAFGRQLDGSRDLDEHICLRCLGQEEFKWKMNIAQMNDQITRARRKYLQRLEPPPPTPVHEIIDATEEALPTPPSAMLETPLFVTRGNASRSSPEKGQGQSGYGDSNVRYNGVGDTALSQAQEKLRQQLRGQSGSTQPIASGSQTQPASNHTQNQTQPIHHSLGNTVLPHYGQAQAGPSDHAIMSMQYGPCNPITRANNPNPAYGGSVDNTAGHAQLPLIPVATGYTHPDVRHHGVSHPQYLQQQQQQPSPPQVQLRQHYDDQYDRVRQAQQYMQGPRSLTTDTLTHLYNLPEPTRALTWLQMNYLIQEGAPPIPQLDLFIHYQSIVPHIRQSPYPAVMNGKDFIVMISNHYRHMGMRLDKQTFTILGLWRRQVPVGSGI